MISNLQKKSFIRKSTWLLLISSLWGSQTPTINYQPAGLVATYASMYIYVLKLMLILTIVLGVLYLWKKLAKTTGHQPNSNLKIRERLQLDMRNSIYLIELNGKFFLIASGDKQTTLLDSFGHEEPEVTFVERKSFEDIIKGLKGTANEKE